MKKKTLTKENIAEFKKFFVLPLNHKEFRKKISHLIDQTSYVDLLTFEKALLKNKVVDHFKIKALHGKDIYLYSSRHAEKHSHYQIAQSIFPNGYFCNFSSIYYHELTNQVPNNVFVAMEISRQKDQIKNIENISLSDWGIQRSFIKSHRTSEKIFSFQKHKIILNEKVSRNKTGVETINIHSESLGKNYQTTCLERALIDSIVNPHYNGGITNIQEYYENASNKINIDKFIEIYKNLQFIYPYWQALGLLSEKIGLTKLSKKLYSSFTIKNKFYIDRRAKMDWKFDEKWQTFYPGFLFNEH